MTWPADKRFMTPDQFHAHVAALDFSKWKPIGLVIHNTAEPTLKRWHEVPRVKWMVNLESYYKSLGWNGGPHLFVDDGVDGIGLFNPLNARGTHSPSFNAQWIGIEHVGDYSKEDDDAGAGLKVKQNGIAAMAILCARLGIDPTTHIKLHKEDPRTDHDCPGRDMAQDKQKTIEAVIAYMGDGGDHGPNWGHVVPSEPPGTVPAPVPKPSSSILFQVEGKMSTFGGPRDTGMSPTEGLALYETDQEMAAAGIGDWLLTPEQANATGLGRRLRIEKPYLACRWDYHILPRAFLQRAQIEVTNPKTGKSIMARATDWGPNVKTGRVADLSPGLAKTLGLDTDDVVRVRIYKGAA